MNKHWISAAIMNFSWMKRKRCARSLFRNKSQHFFHSKIGNINFWIFFLFIFHVFMYDSRLKLAIYYVCMINFLILRLNNVISYFKYRRFFQRLAKNTIINNSLKNFRWNQAVFFVFALIFIGWLWRIKPCWFIRLLFDHFSIFYFHHLRVCESAPKLRFNSVDMS